MFGKENNLNKGHKPPTIVAYQPQINFYYPNQMVETIESPISHRFDDSFLSNRRKDPLLSSHESFFHDGTDYRIEIERRYKQSKTNKGYIFPRKLTGPPSKSGSLDQLELVDLYDLKDQNLTKKTHIRTKTDASQVPRSQIDIMQHAKPNRGQSAGRQASRIKTEGNQPDDMISITNIKNYNPRQTQPMPKKPEGRSFDAYRLMFGLPAQTDRGSGKTKRPDLSVPRNLPSKAYSKSPLILQQPSKGLSTYGIGTTRITTGPKTERKAYLNLGGQYLNKAGDRMMTMPTDFEEVPPLNDLIKQYERLKLKQIDLISKHGQFVGQMRQESTGMSPQQQQMRSKHQRTTTYNDRNPWLKTEADRELGSSFKRKMPQKTNYFQKKDSNFR